MVNQKYHDLELPDDVTLPTDTKTFANSDTLLRKCDVGEMKCFICIGRDKCKEYPSACSPICSRCGRVISNSYIFKHKQMEINDIPVTDSSTLCEECSTRESLVNQKGDWIKAYSVMQFANLYPEAIYVFDVDKKLKLAYYNALISGLESDINSILNLPTLRDFKALNDLEILYKDFTVLKERLEQVGVALFYPVWDIAYKYYEQKRSYPTPTEASTASAKVHYVYNMMKVMTSLNRELEFLL